MASVSAAIASSKQYFSAIQRGDLQAFLPLLYSRGPNLIEAESGKTALQLAVLAQRPAIVDAILSHAYGLGHLNTTTDAGVYPLLQACGQQPCAGPERLEIVKRLLACKALDLNYACERKVSTPSPWGPAHPPSVSKQYDGTPLLMAILCKDVEVVELLCADERLDPNYTPWSAPPLSFAVSTKASAEIIDALLRNPKVEVNRLCASSKGYSAMHYAVLRGDPVIIARIGHHKDANLTLKSRGSSKTPMELAETQEVKDLLLDININRMHLDMERRAGKAIGGRLAYAPSDLMSAPDDASSWRSKGAGMMRPQQQQLPPW